MRKQWILPVALMAMAAAECRADQYTSFPAFQTASQNLTLVNFDTLPGGGAAPSSGDIGNSYAVWGVVFPTGNFFSSLTGPVSSPDGWVNNTIVDNQHFFDANFTAGGITAVGVYSGLFSAQATLRAYDASHNLLASVTGDNDGQTNDFFGVTTTTAIARIEISIAPTSGWALDNLYFGQARAVPEPSSIVLCGLGTIGVATFARRRARLAAA